MPLRARVLSFAALAMILPSEMAYAATGEPAASPPVPSVAAPPPAAVEPSAAGTPLPAEAGAGNSTGAPPGDAPPPPPPPQVGPPGPVYSNPGYPPRGYPPPQSGYPPPEAYAPTGGYGPVCPPPPPCPCQVAPPPPGARVHDGVYLRMQLGATFTGLSAKSDSTHLEFAGSGPTIGVALGKTVRPDLALYGSFSLSSAVDPRVTRNGVDTTMVSGSTDMVLFGVGIAYYLEPANIFLAATAGVSKLDFQDSQNVVLYESKWGVGGELLAGKEWWVADEWGIGVSGQLSLATARGKGALSPGESSATWTGTAFSILFSSTYN